MNMKSSIWKRVARATLCIAAGSLLLAGCASSGLSEEEEKVVGGWHDMAEVLKDARDPDLTAPSKTGIASLDVVADIVMPISGSVAKMAEGYICKTYADTAWNSYTGWYNGPEANKLKDAALEAAKKRQSKMATYEQGMAIAGGDVLASAKQVYKFRKLNPADTEAVDAFLAEASKTTNLTTWADALIAAQGKDRKDFYAAVIPEVAKAKPVPLSQRIEELSNNMVRLQKAVAQLQKALTDADLAKRIAMAQFGQDIVEGVDGKETMKIIERLQKQLTVTMRLTPWMIDALRSAE